MIFYSKRNTREKKRKARLVAKANKGWRKWFAWRPIKLEYPDATVWLDVIERQFVYSPRKPDTLRHGESFDESTDWEYRLQPKNDPNSIHYKYNNMKRKP